MVKSTKKFSLNKFQTHIKILLIPFLLLLSYFCFAQNVFSTRTIFQELEDYDQMIVTTDLESLFTNNKNEDWQKATVNLKGEGKKSIDLKIKIKTRGKFRKMTCDIPPLKFNFNKTELENLGLNRDFDKLKIVNPCFEDFQNQQNLMKEFWIYQMYEKVTEQSFKTHRLGITYIDKNDSTKVIQGNGFIIEPAKEMAQRIGGEVVDSVGIKIHQVSTTSFHRSILFYYMVGNTDWNIASQKNLKLIQLKGDNLYTIVPYDFDMSKLVDPPYMVLYPNATFTNNRNRYVKCYSNNKEILNQEKERFSLLKKSGFQDYKKCEILTNKEKRKMEKYLKSFFNLLEKEKRMVRIFWKKNKRYANVRND